MKGAATQPRSNRAGSRYLVETCFQYRRSSDSLRVDIRSSLEQCNWPDLLSDFSGHMCSHERKRWREISSPALSHSPMTPTACALMGTSDYLNACTRRNANVYTFFKLIQARSRCRALLDPFSIHCCTCTPCNLLRARERCSCCWSSSARLQVSILRLNVQAHHCCSLCGVLVLEPEAPRPIRRAHARRHPCPHSPRAPGLELLGLRSYHL